jgi:hypothetical protein
VRVSESRDHVLKADLARADAARDATFNNETSRNHRVASSTDGEDDDEDTDVVGKINEGSVETPNRARSDYKCSTCDSKQSCHVRLC